MTRKRPDDRIARLVEIATEVFISSQGYQRTQMDEVARQLGVSKGSLYLYVESKEALFDLCVRYADDPDAVTRDEFSLPYKSAGGEEALGYVQVRLAQDPAFQEMIGILLTEESLEPARDLERLVRILYGALGRNRKSIKLIEAAASDHPNLSKIWYPNARGQLLEVLLPFVERHLLAGAFRPLTSAPIAARHLIETCTFWAVHRHWDPSPQSIDEDKLEDALVELVLRVFLKDAP
jgi:AcrR family transcriptional regulator